MILAEFRERKHERWREVGCMQSYLVEWSEEKNFMRKFFCQGRNLKVHVDIRFLQNVNVSFLFVSIKNFFLKNTPETSSFKTN